jgi:hypothetical protein
MTKEVLKLALEALTYIYTETTADEDELIDKAITAIKEALAQPEKPKYRRGDRLICLETEEYCVIHISGTDRQWVKFPDSHIGVYTNEQVSELFELLPKEPCQEPVPFICEFYAERASICLLRTSNARNKIERMEEILERQTARIVELQDEIRNLTGEE